MPSVMELLFMKCMRYRSSTLFRISTGFKRLQLVELVYLGACAVPSMDVFHYILSKAVKWDVERVQGALKVCRFEAWVCA